MAPGTTAYAQSTEQGRSLYMSADFQGSVQAFEGVLRSADATRANILEAHRYLAALYLMLGQQDNANQHAADAVALDPLVAAPAGTPPEVGSLLQSAARRVGHPATLTIAAGALTLSKPGTIRLHLAPAPPGLATNLHLACGDADQRGPSPDLTLNLTPTASTLHCTAEALSVANAVLVQTERDLSVQNNSGGPPPSGASLWPWIAIGAGAAVVVITVIIIAAIASKPSDAQIGSSRVEGW